MTDLLLKEYFDDIMTYTVCRGSYSLAKYHLKEKFKNHKNINMETSLACIDDRH